MSKRIRNCCFTVNNYKDKKKIIKFFETASYIVIGEEVGAKGTPHLQGYAEWVNAVSFKKVHKNIELGHIERRKGTPMQASEYCKKDGKFFERGDISNQGKRTDLNDIKDDIDEGFNVREIILRGSAKNFQGIKTAEKLLEYFEKPRTEKPIVKWFYGKTGRGKSFTARAEALEIYDPKDIYKANFNGKWFNGYDGQKAIIIDDIRKDWKVFEDMLLFCDEGEYRVETKGSMRQLVAKHIWITCPWRPEECYEMCINEDTSQLTSRLSVIRKFSGKNRRAEVLEIGTEVFEGDTRETDTEVVGNTYTTTDEDF